MVNSSWLYRTHMHEILSTEDYQDYISLEKIQTQIDINHQEVKNLVVSIESGSGKLEKIMVIIIELIKRTRELFKRFFTVLRNKYKRRVNIVEDIIERTNRYRPSRVSGTVTIKVSEQYLFTDGKVSLIKNGTFSKNALFTTSSGMRHRQIANGILGLIGHHSDIINLLAGRQPNVDPWFGWVDDLVSELSDMQCITDPKRLPGNWYVDGIDPIVKLGRVTSIATFEKLEGFVRQLRVYAGSTSFEEEITFTDRNQALTGCKEIARYLSQLDVLNAPADYEKRMVEYDHSIARMLSQYEKSGDTNNAEAIQNAIKIQQRLDSLTAMAIQFESVVVAMTMRSLIEAYQVFERAYLNK